MEFINKDDAFLLGNIGMFSISAGLGEYGLPLLKFIQKYRPENAGSYIGEALFHMNSGNIEEAINVLENSPAFIAEKNSDEALAFHLFITYYSGDIEKTRELGTAYLEEKLVTDKNCIESIKEIMKLI